MVDGTGEVTGGNGGNASVLLLADNCLHDHVAGEVGYLADVGAVADGHHFRVIDIGLHDTGHLLAGAMEVHGNVAACDHIDLSLLKHLIQAAGVHRGLENAVFHTIAVMGVAEGGKNIPTKINITIKTKNISDILSFFFPWAIYIHSLIFINTFL